jgi:uncharacterized protein (TIGR02302 family)
MSFEPRHEKLKRLDRKVSWQRLFMSFENLWSVWFRPLMVLGVAGIVIASGVLTPLPIWFRLAVLAVLVLALLWTLLPLFNMPRIKRLMVLRKLEQASTVSHRGFSSADDKLAPEFMDPRAESVWEEHKARQLATLDVIKTVPPQSRWRMFDPVALRVPVALGLVAAVLLGAGGFTQNLREATRITVPPPAIPLTLDAWLRPPAYTGRPPLLLTSTVIQEKVASGGAIEVPENSAFTLRVSGAATPKITFLSPGTDMVLTDVTAKTTAKDGTLSAEATLARPATILVTDGNRELARWPVTLIPDAAPTLKLTEKPQGDRKANLTMKWQAQDDYGVKKLTGELELADEQEGGEGFESNGVFLFEAPEMKFVMRRSNSKDEKGASKFDFSKHPWAGLNVTLNMTAIDGAGQEGKLEPVTFKLPERVFSRPLPRALIEQRKQLILFPERAGHVGKLLDTINLYPKGLFEDRAPSIMMGVIASRLRNASGYSDVHQAIDDLWTLAVKLEEGSLSDLRAELKNLKEELEKALREGAPQERIDELMNKMREAMNRYMDALREESERMAQNGDQPQNSQDGKSISREDLERMMKELEEMQKNGNSDMAQQMLDQLNELLQNLQPGGQQQADGDGSGEDMMQGLGDMMRKQRRLMDETQRMGRGDQPGQQGEGQQPGEGQGQGQGEQGQSQGESQQDGQGGGLADRQGQLRGQLDGLRGQGGNNQSLDDAGRAMGEAEERLRNGDREGALQKQGEALDKLRRGAQELAQQMRERGQGREGAQARDGEGRSGEEDPLGRPRASRGVDEGPEKDMLPTEQARERAREILEQLRAKANERGLSDQEKAYIERLMRGLY